jgi:arylsulfatase A-like enzyme
MSRRPNVLLLVADSLRADRLSCYGCPRPTSPRLDALAGSGARFLRFFTPATPTEPACTSLLTGQFPLTHGILAPSRRRRLSRRAPWLPGILAAQGYATAILDDLAWSEHWGRGFGARLYRRTSEDEYLDGFAMNRMARPWLAAQRKGPFFLYLRYGDTHTPYWPPARYRTLFYAGDPTTTNRGSLDAFYARPLKPYLGGRWLEPAARAWPGAAGRRIEDLEWCRAQYDAEVRALDDAVAELLDGLEGLGMLENTLVAVLGDHGESLGEHGIFFEHHGLYDVTLRPPLIVHAPGRIAAGQRIESVVMTPDLAPTILELLGLPIPAGPPASRAMEGRSLVPLLAGQPTLTPRRVVAASEATWMCKWAYRTAEYKLIVAREPDLYGGPPVELYDLAADPAETVNLADTRPDVRDGLRAEFEGWLGQRLTASGRRGDPVRAHGSMHRKFLRPLPLRKRIKRAVRAWWRGTRPATPAGEAPAGAGTR